MIQRNTKVYTYADYCKLEEGSPYQLIDGALVMSPSPTRIHQRIVLHLSSELHRVVEQQKLGQVFVAPFDVYLSDTEVFQPDVLYVSNESLGQLTEQNLKGAPDMVIEVLSPSTAFYDIRHKKSVYEQAGVIEYWIIDPINFQVEQFFREGEQLQLVDLKKRSGTMGSKILSCIFNLDTIFSL